VHSSSSSTQQVINKFKPIIFSKIKFIIIHLTILFFTVIALLVMLPPLALSPPKVYYMTLHQPNIYPMNGLVSASPLEEHDNYGINGPIGFNATGIIGENSIDAIYPAFSYNLSKIEQFENKNLTTNSSFLPVPDLVSETRTPSQEASTAEDASEITQSAIEKMVNPSSLLSSAIDDIRKSGNDGVDKSQDVQKSTNKTISFLNTEFSTIPLYGMNIPPKDYLIVSSNEAGSDGRGKLFATARLPCNDKHQTPVRVVLLENWSSITYPPLEMHLIDSDSEGQLCMFRVEYPENGIVDSYITTTTAEKSSTRNHVASTAIVLYNSGTSALRFPMASSITISHLGSL
jgi:hypothetical protein